MIDVDELYFEWLLTVIDQDGVSEGVTYLCGLLHECDFRRRVGRDINRAADGAALRKEFFEEFSPNKFDVVDVNDLLAKECTWLEMLIALARHLDFLYEGGVDGRFAELITNMKLGHLAVYHPGRNRPRYDRRTVVMTTSDIDNNRFNRNGEGGIFPLRKNNHPDQREVEIWDQQAAYFRERFEGVLWTSTN